MHFRTMAFGFGLITGAALTISLPYFVSKAKEMCRNDDRENHESNNVKKVTDDIKQEFSKLSSDVNEDVDEFMKKMEKDIKSKKKKKKK